MADQVDTPPLSTGWERGVPVQDTLARRFVFAYADRIDEMARRTGGRTAERDGARMADLGSPFGYDNAVAPELPAMLISSDDGHPVYLRLGFWDLFRATMWEHPPR